MIVMNLLDYDSNHLYYTNFCISDKDSSSFERISTNVKEIYVLVLLKIVFMLLRII